MKLLDLDPRWLLDQSGRRVGFIFISPLQRARSDGTINPTPYRQTCFAEKLGFRDQSELVWSATQDLAHVDRKFGLWQSCNSDVAWKIADGIETADFASLSVLPSIDGSAGGLWHGFITNGEIVGGI